jgi:phage terminase small subunit
LETNIAQAVMTLRLCLATVMPVVGIILPLETAYFVGQRTTMDNGVPAALPAGLVTVAPTSNSAWVALRPKQEAFAQAYAAHGNASRAYREAFDCGGTMKPNVIRQRGYELAHHPTVAARIRALFEAAAKDTTISARARMVRLQEITEADPGELVRTVVECCRSCHGAGHNYQWHDDADYARAWDAAIADSTPLPSMAGGFGFSPHLPPHDDCPACSGYGVPRVVVTPTDQLSPSARRLLKAVRQKSDGSIEVQMHDQLAASDQLNRMQGVYVEKSVAINANVAIPVPDKVSAADALAFIKSLTPS